METMTIVLSEAMARRVADAMVRQNTAIAIAAKMKELAHEIASQAQHELDTMLDIACAVDDKEKPARYEVKLEDNVLHLRDAPALAPVGISSHESPDQATDIAAQDGQRSSGSARQPDSMAGLHVLGDIR